MTGFFLPKFRPVKTPGQKTEKLLYSLKVCKTDIAIDCGANVGNVTRQLAKRGATVYCFEPNPFAFEVLQKRFSDQPNIHCIPAGVGAEAGRFNLYMHENSDKNEVYWSTGSSLLECKGNVRQDKYVEVEIVDLCAFIEELGRRVKVLKMDVEGVECSILRKLIESGVIAKVDHAFVETHDHRIPELKAETDEIREWIREKGIRHINLDWG